LARDAASWNTDLAKPLIFDSRVQGALAFIGRAFGAYWESPLRARVPPAERYLHYCRTAQRWAHDLDLGPGVAGAEQIERFSLNRAIFGSMYTTKCAGLQQRYCVIAQTAWQAHTPGQQRKL
jgi:hypothetical protein